VSAAGSVAIMSGPTSLRWRVLRSAAFAAVATSLAAVGHILGGGDLPDVAMLVPGAGTIGLVCTGLAFRRGTLPAIIGLMAGCQLAFHLLFGAGMHASQHPSVGAGWTGAMHRTTGTGPWSVSVAMVGFHVVAGVLSAAVLAKGEAALFGLFAALRRIVRPVKVTFPVHLPPRWTASFPAVLPRRPTGTLLTTSPRRGPPAVVKVPSTR